MIKIVLLNDVELITKSTAMRLLGYSNHNSIEYLINKKNLRVFEIPNTRRKLIALDDIKKLHRFKTVNESSQKL